MVEDQLHKLILEYVMPNNFSDKIKEFQKKVVELGLSMDIPEDIIEEIALVCKIYE